MVGEEDGAAPKVHGTRRVVGVEDALEQNRQRRQRSQPVQVVPAQGRFKDGGHTGQCRAIGHGRIACRYTRCQVDYDHPGWEREAIALIRLAPPEHWRVDGDDQRRGPSCCRAFDEVTGAAAVGEHICRAT